MIPDLSRRAVDRELLDEGVPEAEALASLQDLRLVNRWLGGSGRVLAELRRHLPRGGRLLDVGAASGDLPARAVERLPGPPRAVALDVKRLHLRFAPASLWRVVADVRALPFAEGSFDVVTASLFLHHFATPELPSLIAGLFRLARHAVVISDLRRARVPYVFGRLLFPVLFRSRVSVTDGLVSIRRGFLRRELVDAFVAAGLTQVRVAHHFPYRLLAVAVRDGDGGARTDGRTGARAGQSGG